ncbi:ABC transporter permease [Shimia isoporae]|nr:ABC transporter permease [Shimia isoporae]
MALILREMSTTFGRTAFGYLWAILQPVAGIILLTAIFSIALRKPDLGTSFALFYATGLLPFLAFLDISGKVALSIEFSRSLLSFPAVSYLDALLGRLILNTLTQIMVFGLVISATVFIYDQSVAVNYPKIIFAWFLLTLLSAGVGTFNCYMFLRFPEWERIYSVIRRPLLIISCVFYLYEVVPPPYSDYLWFNPLIHIVGMIRSSIFFNYDAAYVSPLYVICFSALPLLIGMTFLHKNSRDLLYR